MGTEKSNRIIIKERTQRERAEREGTQRESTQRNSRIIGSDRIQKWRRKRKREHRWGQRKVIEA